MDCISSECTCVRTAVVRLEYGRLKIIPPM